MTISPKKSGKPIIGVDIDNVLSDTDLVIRNLIEQEFGVKSRKEQITNWDYFESLSITPDQEESILHLFHNQYCSQIPVIQFAQESLKSLSTNYLIWLVTSRPAKSNALTKDWLIRHNITYDNLIYTYKKVDLFGVVRLIIEDNGKTAIEFAKKGMPVILFNYPWNAEYHHSLIFRVDNWLQALEIIAENQFSRMYLH